MGEALTSIRRARIVPVVVLDDLSTAKNVVAALQAGGITCAEFTLRTDAGIAAINAVAGTPNFTVGAGTVLNIRDVDACVDAGAEFIVSPGFDRDVVEYAMGCGITVLPGVATASEIQAASRIGLNALKLFPADQLGGLNSVTSFSGPFPELQFMPSGGVGLGNARQYLAHPSVFAISGSWMVPRAMIAAGNFEGIRQLSTEAIQFIGSDE